jgi:hypothetical protein
MDPLSSGRIYTGKYVLFLHNHPTKEDHMDLMIKDYSILFTILVQFGIQDNCFLMWESDLDEQHNDKNWHHRTKIPHKTCGTHDGKETSPAEDQRNTQQSSLRDNPKPIH